MREGSAPVNARHQHGASHHAGWQDDVSVDGVFAEFERSMIREW